MRVELVRIKFDGKEVCYKYKPMEYCCEKFKLNPVIVFDAQEEFYNNYCDNCEEYKKNGYFLDEHSKCVSCDIRKEYFDDSYQIPNFFIYSSEEIHDWEDSWLQEDYYKVDFCPHCGEKIEISVVDEIDASEKYRELTSKRDELNKKRRKTDSKKREYKLTEEIRELDRLINDFYGVSEYKEELYK